METLSNPPMTQNPAITQPTAMHEGDLHDRSLIDKPRRNNTGLFFLLGCGCLVIILVVVVGLFLTGSSLFGISVAQINARDTARKAAAQDINVGIADFFSQTGEFPSALGFEEGTVVISETSGLSCPADGVCILVSLGTVTDPATTTTLGAGVTSIGETDADSSRWCFQPQLDGYSLAVELENGEVFQAGTSANDCNFERGDMQVSPTAMQRSDLLTYKNELIPGFSFNYPEDWKLEQKDFNQGTDPTFKTEYTSDCGGSCLGIRLMKAGVTLQYILQVAYDDQGSICSNSVTFERIPPDWFRIKDDSGYLYSNRAETDAEVPTGTSSKGMWDRTEYLLYGTTLPESIPTTKYDICVTGTGVFLINESKLTNSQDTSSGAPVLLENPRVFTAQTQILPELLDELDSIITSTKGLE